jgi:hypothetical protein
MLARLKAIRIRSRKMKAYVALAGGLIALLTRATADDTLDLSDVEANGLQALELLATAWAVWRAPNATDPGENTQDQPSV